MKTKIAYLTMALVIALSMAIGGLLVVQAPPVAASPGEVTNVWVQFTASTYNRTDTASDFSIHFTPNTALSRYQDTITVWFPDGSTDMGPDNFDLSSAVTTADYYSVDRDGEVTTYSATDITAAATLSQSGYRITVRTPVDLDAGVDTIFRVEAAAGVKCADLTTGAHHDPYYVKLYTSQDTTPVKSDAFNIDATGIDATTLTLSPDTAGSAAQYKFLLETGAATELTAGEDTVSVIFPYGTTIPAAGGIDADQVSWSNDAAASWSTGTVIPTINQKARMITCTTPITLSTSDTDNYIKFATGANIVNPIVATTYTGYYVMTNEDELQVAEGGQAIAAGAATKLGFNNDALPSGCYADDATMINMYSSCLFLLVQDAYGNLKSPDSQPTVTYTSTGGSGTFHYNESADGTGLLTMTQDNTYATTSGYGYMYYLPTTSGRHTITAEASGYDNGTWTIDVAPGVELYDSYNNLIETYEPLSTAPASETSDEYAGDTQKHGGTYVQDALNASVTGDTVKLGGSLDNIGIYEVDTALSLAQKITLTSKTGKAYTKLRPTTDAIHALQFGSVTGTLQDPITISNLTFTWLRNDYEFDCAISNQYADYVTVSGCTFEYVEPDTGSSGEAVIWFQAGARDFTSIAISNNTFTNNVLFTSSFTTGNIVFDGGGSSHLMTGVTISDNRLTDCNGYGIAFGGRDTTNMAAAVIQDNILTRVFSPICLCDYAHTTDGIKVLGNTITNGYRYGIKVEGGNNGPITIKNNTIDNTVGQRAAIRIENAPLTADGTYTHYVQYNDITNTHTGLGYAIYVDGTIDAINDLDCSYNWYGNATGPAYTALTGATVSKSNPNGTGDPITDRVFYYPWLHTSKATVVTDNASYQTSTVDLVIGWNTLSTPVELIPAGDTIGELIPTGRTIGYYYDAFDADADLDYWELLENSYELSPCDAVYVKMSVAKTVQLKFDANEFTTPTKDLAAGWNMASLAYLSSSGMAADDAVASVYLTAANLPGYSQVVSPSLNTLRRDMYYNQESSWSDSRAQHGAASGNSTMYATYGYWIYMLNAATLAGHTITPIAPDLD